MADALVIAASAESSRPLVAAARRALGADAELGVLVPPSSESTSAELVAAAVVRTLAADGDVCLVLTAAGLSGDEVAGRVAASARAACSLAVSDLARDRAGNWTWTRATYGGALEARCRCRGVLVASMDCRSVPPDRAGRLDGVPVTALDVDDGAGRTAVESRAPEREAVALPAAERIIAGGRGLGGPDGFAELEALAAAVGADLAASRPPCDAGWMPSSRQVGITGHKVAPDLYIAVGISGSVQHLAGIRGAGTVVAVNSDAEAAIFRHADLGVVGNWREVVADLRSALVGGGN